MISILFGREGISRATYKKLFCLEDYRFETVPVPEPGPGEILVRVEAVGICAGDAKTYAGATRFWGNRQISY